MLESSLLQEFITARERLAASDTARKNVVRVLRTRFGPDADRLDDEMKTVDEDRLNELIEVAVRCTDLQSFREQLLHDADGVTQ